MKLLSALTLTALLSASAAFAADAPAGGTVAMPAKHMSLKACNKQADEKKLTGTDRSAFVKECHGSKKG